MKTIKAVNVNDAYYVGILMLKEQGKLQKSQHGDTLEMPEPVSVMYCNPRQRVLFDSVRDANPFLHFFEALWIIRGRDDEAFLRYLVPNMSKYSDDGVSFYGAYGFRMQNTDLQQSLGNQLEEAVRRLQENPDDRQVVLQIRYPDDMWYKGKDQPCNLAVALKVRDGALNMHVLNRSNDFIWGLTGANVVQFSTLLEYLAGRIGVEVGVYHQTTDSMHVYVNEQWEKVSESNNFTPDAYLCGDVRPYPMMQGDLDDWHDDLEIFFQVFDSGVRSWPRANSPFFRDVVWPMWATFIAYKDYRTTKAELQADMCFVSSAHIAAEDWKLAVNEWMNRRIK